MSNDIKTDILPREAAEENTAPTSMSLFKPSTVYDKKSFELSVTTRSTTLPFPNEKMFKLPIDNDKISFTIPFNSIYRRLLDNDLFNERLLCVVNGGDPYYGANLINNLCAVLTSSTDTYVCCPQVKSQEVSVVRQTEASIEEAMKNKLGYNYPYHKRLISIGTLKTVGEVDGVITDKMYDEYINYVKGRLSSSVAQAEKFIRYVPSNVHFVTYNEGRYYFGTNHGLFMSENPFLENALCAQASVVWPYGHNNGKAFVDNDNKDLLHAGLFNHIAVEGITGKTMLGTDVYGNVAANPRGNIEGALPQFDVFALMATTFDLSSKLSVLTPIEGVAGTSHGLWVLLNTADRNDGKTHKVRELEGWEEDQTSANVVSYDWVSINESCEDPSHNGNSVSLTDLSVTSIVRSEKDPATFYLGSSRGLFSCTFRNVYKTQNDFGDDVLAVGADFRYVYGFYDASISSMVYVHPNGYDDSVLAGTDYGVLQATNSWYPRIDRTYKDWISQIDFNSNVVTAIGVDAIGIPRLVSLSSNTTSALYKISGNTLTPIYAGNVYGIYRGILNNAWVVVSYKQSVTNPAIHNVEVLKIPESNNPATVTSNDLIAGCSINNCTGIKKCFASRSGSIYIIVSGTGHEDKVYQLSKRRDGQNTLEKHSYTPRANEKVLAVAATTSETVSDSQDTIFVATERSIYAFVSGLETSINFFTDIATIENGSNVRIVGHSTFGEMNGLDVVFYQHTTGTYAGKASDFNTATSHWTKIDDLGTETVIDDSITSLLIPDYGRIVVTRGGVFKTGLTADNELWFGKSSTDSSPIIEGSFTGALLLDDPENEDSLVRILLLVGLENNNKVLYLYVIDTAENDEPVFQEKMTGLTGSIPKIVSNPFNNKYQLSALVPKGNRLNNVSTHKIISTSEFDPDTITEIFADMTVDA